MDFNENFRSKLQTSLINNIPLLRDSSIDVVNEVKDNYCRIILNDISDEYYPLRISPERAIYNISRSLEVLNMPKLKLRNDDWAVFRENEIDFRIIKNDEPEWHSKEQLQYRVDTEDLLYECQEEFWKDLKKNSSYNEIANFLCLEDTEFPLNEFEKIRNRGNIDVYNIESWSDYVFKLVEMNFPDFKYEKSKSNRKFRFLKSINDDIEFGFEYDNTGLKSLIKNKKGIQLPNYFNIIVINKGFKPKEKLEHIFHYHDNIISLGILGNPFFYHPCYPLGSFAIVELYHYGNFYPDNREPKKVRDFVKINDETIKVVHLKEYGEKLKKHAFFYMDLLGYSSKSYLDYVEKCVLDVI